MRSQRNGVVQARFRYYIPDPNTANAEPFSLTDVLERFVYLIRRFSIVFDHSQISFSPLVSRAYIGPRAHEFSAAETAKSLHARPIEI